MSASSRFSLGAVVLGVLASGPAVGQSVLSLSDEASGTTRVFTESDSTFEIWGDGAAVGLLAGRTADAWYLLFEAPEGQRLAPGSYGGVGCRAPLRHGRSPGMEITNNNPVCSPEWGNTLWGSFVIRQIEYAANGQVSTLEAKFTQRNGSPTAPALGGLIRYNTRPLSLGLKSDPGFFDGPIVQASHGDTSLFSLEGNLVEGIDYTASVSRDLWQITIQPPIGQPLAVRRYPARATAQPGRAGLTISRGPYTSEQSDRWAMSCRDARGSLTIEKLRTNAEGAIVGLRARFEYRCGGAAPALRGTIRFHD